MKQYSIKSPLGLIIEGKLLEFPLNASNRSNYYCDIIFIHAFPFDSEMYVKNFTNNKFSAQLNELALEKGSLRIILPDLNGFGASTNLKSTPNDLSPYIKSINKIVNHFGIRKLILGGCSMGGYIVLEYLRTHPEVVEGLILIDTKTEADNIEQKQNRYKSINLFKGILESISNEQRTSINLNKLKNKHSEVKDFIENLYNRIVSKITIEKELDKANFIKKLMESQKPIGIIHALSGMANRQDTSLVLKKFEKNVLIIVGELDVITPIEIAQKMNNLTPKGTLRVITSAGHLSNIENISEFNRMIINWLRRLNL